MSDASETVSRDRGALGWVAALVAGALFALGLTLSGMTRPSRMLAFLDVTGSFDASLAVVMVGAVVTTAVGTRLALIWKRPVFAERFDLPSDRRIDQRLVAGSLLFGAGWGLAGVCPGPALVALGSAKLGAVLFVAAMLVGMALADAVGRRARGGGDG